MVPFNFSFFRNFHSAQAGETSVCACVLFQPALVPSLFHDILVLIPLPMSDCCCLLTDQIRYIEPSVMPPPANIRIVNC